MPSETRHVTVTVLNESEGQEAFRILYTLSTARTKKDMKEMEWHEYKDIQETCIAKAQALVSKVNHRLIQEITR